MAAYKPAPTAYLLTGTAVLLSLSLLLYCSNSSADENKQRTAESESSQLTEQGKDNGEDPSNTAGTGEYQDAGGKGESTTERQTNAGGNAGSKLQDAAGKIKLTPDNTSPRNQTHEVGSPAVRLLGPGPSLGGQRSSGKIPDGASNTILLKESRESPARSRLQTIKDGSSNTVILRESAENTGRDGIPSVTDGSSNTIFFGEPAAQSDKGGKFVFGDGSVHQVPNGKDGSSNTIRSAEPRDRGQFVLVDGSER